MIIRLKKAKQIRVFCVFFVSFVFYYFGKSLL